MSPNPAPGQGRQSEPDQLTVQDSPIIDALIRCSVDGILAFDQSCRFTVWNEALERMTGAPVSQVLGRPAFEVFPCLKEGGEERYFAAALAGRCEVAADRPYAVFSPDQPGFFEGHYSPLRNASGEIIGGLAIIRDVTERRRTEEESRRLVQEQTAQLLAEATQQRIATVLDRVTDGFCAFDRDWRYTYLNQEAINLLPRLGKRMEDLLGAIVWDEFPDLVGTEFEKKCRQALVDQASAQFELFYAPIAAWFEIRAYPSSDGLSLFFQEVTERRRQLERLQEQREELAVINEELQVSNEELEAANEELRLQQEELAVAAEEIEAQREELAVSNSELRQQHAEVLATNDALRASERRFQAILNQKLGFLALLKPDGTLVDCNQLPLDVGGLTRSQVLGRPFWGAPWWHGLPDAQELLERDVSVAGRGGVAHGRSPYRLADGSLGVVEYSFSPVMDDADRVTLVIGEGRDTTDRVRAEERERFLAAASDILTSSLDYELTMERVARHALPYLADLCMVDLVDSDGQLHRVATAHTDQAGELLLHELQQRFPPRPDSAQPAVQAFRGGKTDLLVEITDETVAARTYNQEHFELIRRINIRSHLAVPLVARGRTIGVINFGLVGDARRYGPEHVALAEELARRAALAVDNARLYQEAQREIAERRCVEEALRGSEERYRSVVQNVRDVIFQTNAAGEWVLLNPAWEAITGFLLEESLGAPVLGYVHPDDRDRNLELFRPAAGDGENRWHCDVRFLHRDGGFRWIEVSAHAMRDAEGRLTGSFGILRDVTEQKRLFQELQDTQLRFQAIFNQSSTFLGILTPDGAMADINQTALNACGVAREEIIGIPFWDIPWWNRSLEAQGLLRADFQRALGGEAVRREAPYFSPSADEPQRWMDRSLTPIKDHSGNVVLVNAECRDITKRKQLHTELEQRVAELAEADRQKHEFLAMLSHELRNPLAPIQNTLGILRASTGMDASLRHPMDVLQRQAQNLTRLVDDLLDVSRITRGIIELRPETLDLRAVIENAVQTSRPVIDASEHRFSISLPSHALPVQGDPTRLEQVLTNLLTNAAKYTEPGGQIRVTASREEAEAVIRVADSGRGIPPEMLPRIFDLFTQVNPTLDRVQGGLGLGLTLVKRLTEMHHGAVSAASNGSGQGSEFTVRLPLARIAVERQAAPRSAAGAVKASQSLRVLIVDDNRDAAESLAELLEIWGHKVHLAHEGYTAVEAGVALRPDFVLLDIGLPGMDGYEVARRLFERLGDGLRLVAVTGYGQDADRKRAFAAGFQHHLVKPVNLDELQRLLHLPNS